MQKTIVLIAALALFLTGCSTQAANSQSSGPAVKLSGVVRSVLDTRTDIMKYQAGEACSSGRDPKVVSGSQVTLLDSSGKLLSVGTLSAGSVVRPDSGNPNYLCSMSWKMDTHGLTDGLYTLRIADSSPDLAYSLADLKNAPTSQIGTLYWH